MVDGGGARQQTGAEKNIHVQDELWNEIQFNQILAQAESKLLTRDHTTAFFGNEGESNQQFALVQAGYFHSLGLYKIRDFWISLSGGVAGLTKGRGNYGHMITKAAGYGRFNIEDEMESEDITAQLTKILESVRRK